MAPPSTVPDEAVSGFGFSRWLRSLEGPLTQALGLEPVALPLPLTHARGSWQGVGVSLAARAWRGPRVRYLRAVTVCSDDDGRTLDIANLLALPEGSLEAPVLGVDAVSTGKGRALVVADLSPLLGLGPEREAEEAALSAALSEVATRLSSAGELPAWSRRWFSRTPLFARLADEGTAPVARGCLGRYVEVWRTRLDVPRPPGPEGAGLQRQLAYLQAHREEDKAMGFLGRVFPPELAKSLIDEVLFPERLPAPAR